MGSTGSTCYKQRLKRLKNYDNKFLSSANQKVWAHACKKPDKPVFQVNDIR